MDKPTIGSLSVPDPCIQGDQEPSDEGPQPSLGNPNRELAVHHRSLGERSVLHPRQK